MKFLLPLLFIIVVFSCGERIDSTEKQENSGSIEIVDTVSNPWKDSLDEASTAIRKNVNNNDLYLKRAKIYAEMGDYDAAVSDVERSLAIDSTQAKPYLTLADIYSRNGEIGEVKNALDNALRVEPTNSNVHVKIGELFLYVRNFEQAISHADQAIKYDMYNAEAYYLKGFGFMEMKDTAKAISSFQTAVEQDAEFFNAYLQLGILHSLKNDAMALEYLKNALEIEPNNKEALYTYAMYAQEHEMYNEAIQIYTKLTKIHPDFREAYFNMGYIHMYYLQLYREATKYFTNAIEVDPQFYQAYYNRGYSLELLGDINNAAIDYKKALEIQPDYDFAAKGLTRVTE